MMINPVGSPCSHDSTSHRCHKLNGKGTMYCPSSLKDSSSTTSQIVQDALLLDFSGWPYSRKQSAAVLPQANDAGIHPANYTISPPFKFVHWLANAYNTWKSPANDVEALSRYGTPSTPYINRMPVEVLGEIFIHCLTAITPLQLRMLRLNTLSPSSQADPQTLGEVCRFWRDVTLLTPSLWSRFSIYQPRCTQISKVALWLNRSRRYPLDITIDKYKGSVTPDDRAAIDEILSLLISQVHR